MAKKKRNRKKKNKQRDEDLFFDREEDEADLPPIALPLIISDSRPTEALA